MRLFIALLFGFAPSLFAQRSEKKCRNTPIDSTAPSSPVYRACHTDQAARPLGTPARLNWEPARSEMRDGACFRADIEFVVDTLGVPEASTVRIVKTTNNTFALAAQQQIPSFRYSPAVRDSQPVRQLVDFSYRMGMRMGVTSSPTRTRAPNC